VAKLTIFWDWLFIVDGLCLEAFEQSSEFVSLSLYLCSRGSMRGSPPLGVLSFDEGFLGWLLHSVETKCV